MPNLCDYNNFCVLVRGNIVIIGHNRNQAAFKKCARFIKCITKIGGTTIDDAEYLDLDKPMYNLLQYNFNYSDTAGSLWFYSKHQSNTFNADIVQNKSKFKSLDYKAKLLGNAVKDGDNGTLQMQQLSCH